MTIGPSGPGTPAGDDAPRRPPGVTVRLYDPTDLDALYGIHREVMREYVEATWGPWDEEWQQAHFEETFPARRMQVVLHGYDIAGAIDCQRHRDRWSINRIEIAPEFQNQGIGTWLVTRLVQQARGEDVPVTLEVLKVNEGARRLYARLGFTVTGETNTHWQMRGE